MAAKSEKDPKKTSKFDKPPEQEQTFAFGDTDLVVAGSQQKGFEDVEFSDITIPRVNLLQALSPLVVSPENEDYRAGQLINSATQQIIAKPGAEVYLQFISFYKSRILWFPKSEGGGVRCMSSNGRVGTSGAFAGRDCARCIMSNWQGNTPPECVLYYNFPCLYYGPADVGELDDIDPKQSQPQLMWISFGKTNFSTGKGILNKLKYNGEDIFNRWIEIYSDSKSNQKGTFYILKGDVIKQVNPKVKMAGNNANAFITAMREKIKYAEAHSNDAPEYVEPNIEI